MNTLWTTDKQTVPKHEKTMKNNEEQWNTMKNNENTMKNNEHNENNENSMKHWPTNCPKTWKHTWTTDKQTVPKHEKQWTNHETIKRTMNNFKKHNKPYELKTS